MVGWETISLPISFLLYTSLFLLLLYPSPIALGIGMDESIPTIVLILHTHTFKGCSEHFQEIFQYMLGIINRCWLVWWYRWYGRKISQLHAVETRRSIWRRIGGPMTTIPLWVDIRRSNRSNKKLGNACRNIVIWQENTKSEGMYEEWLLSQQTEISLSTWLKIRCTTDELCQQSQTFVGSSNPGRLSIGGRDVMFLSTKHVQSSSDDSLDGEGRAMVW